MNEDAGELKAIAAEWRRARLLYPIYLGIAKCFALNLSPCSELNSLLDSAEPQAVTGLRRWLQEADELIKPHHLRYFLQTSLLTEPSLHALAEHLVRKGTHTVADRDKLDFLLVQYFVQCAPMVMLKGEPSLEDVAQVLEPVLGKVRVEVPAWLEPLEDLRLQLDECANMHELLQNSILGQIRKLKASATGASFAPSMLVVLTRLNYLIRQTFFRIMRADVEAIREAVRVLRTHGVNAVDGARAQLSRNEPLSRVLELSSGWKKPLQAEYSAGSPFAQLAELRVALDEALQQHGLEVQRSRPALRKPQPAHVSSVATGAAAPAGNSHSDERLEFSAPVNSPFPGALAEASMEAPASGSRNAAAGSAKNSSSSSTFVGVSATAQSWTVRPPAKPVRGASSSTPGETASPQTGLREEMQTIMRQLSTQLPADLNRSRNAGATLVCGNVRVSLSSWEMTAFVQGIGEFSEVIQQAVATRVLLSQTMERVKQGGSREKLAAMIELAKGKADRLEEALAESRDTRNIEATVTLSASLERLKALVNEAEKAGAC